MKPNGEPDKMDAIRSLHPNVGCTLRNGVIEVWQSDQPQPTEEAIQAKLTQLQAEYDAKQYQRDRLQEYPSIQELVVALYDEEDKASIIEKRNAVKAKYPKPE
tara:strand:+ start:2122 stop:2430 length:309 start_codon:yes stop_codon:yes gene_type:complete